MIGLLSIEDRLVEVCRFSLCFFVGQFSLTAVTCLPCLRFGYNGNVVMTVGPTDDIPTSCFLDHAGEGAFVR